MAELNSFLTGIADAIRSKKGTTDKINASNFASEIESIESGSGGGSATVTVPGEWQGTTVPNSGTVSNVYFNTNLSVDEVVKILEQLEYNDSGEFYNILVDTNGNGLYAQTNGSQYLICFYSRESGNYTTYYASFEYNNNDESFIGWNPNISNMQLEINAEVTNYTSWGAEAGHQNDILSSLFSTTPFIKTEDETIELTGDYDGSKVTISNIEPHWQGTPVPNTGYVENVYFNTNLSVEEITNFINKEFDPEHKGGNTIYLLYSENPETNDYIDISMNYSYWNRLYFNITIYTSNGFNGYVFSLDNRYDDISGTNFTGWNPSFSNPFPVNFEVMNQTNGNSIGDKNSLVSFLFSLTPLEYKDEEEASIINLKEYIKEQKLPLQLKLDLPKQLNPLVELLNKTRSCSHLFAYYDQSNIPNLLNYDDTREVYNFSHMYQECSYVTSFPELDTSNGRDFSYMYNGCESATSFPLIDTSNGNNFSHMYQECSYVTSFPELDTSNGTNFSHMYYNCSYVTTLPELDTSNGEDFSHMYDNCSKLTSVPELNTSSGTDFSYMYNGCESATSFPALDTRNGKDFSYMYYDTNATEYPILNTSNGSDFNHMYDSCMSATSLPLIDTRNGEDFSYMYYFCESATSFPELNTSKGTNFSYMYYYCRKATSLPLIDTHNGKDFSYMYSSCRKVTTFPELNTSNGTNFNHMYNHCTSSTSFPLIDTHNGEDFSYMYSNCTPATSFPELNTSYGKNFSYMYNGCESATSFPALDTRNGKDFSYMYNDCESATTFPLIDTSNGINFDHMYYNCNYMTGSITLNTDKGENFKSMFESCKKITKIDISKLSSSTTSTTDCMLFSCHSLKAFIIRSFGESYVLNNSALIACYHISGTKNTGYNPEGLKDGYIYVPRDMIETLSSATNWSNYASQFRALEDYTKDGTTTGEFDDEKAGI